jgi:hypothetical protein
MLKAAFAVEEAQIKLYIVGRSGANRSIIIHTSSGRRLNELGIVVAKSFDTLREESPFNKTGCE